MRCGQGWRVTSATASDLNFFIFFSIFVNQIRVDRINLENALRVRNQHFAYLVNSSTAVFARHELQKKGGNVSRCWQTDRGPECRGR